MFVDWCNEINTYLSYVYKFLGNIKQHLFYHLWKFKVDMLIINHLSSNTFYKVWSPLSYVTFHNLIVFPCYYIFHVTLYTSIHFGPSTQNSNTNIINSFMHEYQFWGTVEWDWQCFTNRRVKINHVSIICLKSSVFPTYTNST